LLTFNIQYSIVFLIVKNDKIENLKGIPLYGKNNNLSHKFFKITSQKHTWSPVKKSKESNGDLTPSYLEQLWKKLKNA